MSGLPESIPEAHCACCHDWEQRVFAAESRAVEAEKRQGELELEKLNCRSVADAWEKENSETAKYARGLKDQLSTMTKERDGYREMVTELEKATEHRIDLLKAIAKKFLLASSQELANKFWDEFEKAEYAHVGLPAPRPAAGEKP